MSDFSQERPRPHTLPLVPEIGSDEAGRYRLAVAAGIVVMVAVRLVVAAKVPLAFDEALY